MQKSLVKNIDIFFDKITPSRRGGIDGYFIASMIVVIALVVRLAIAPPEAGLPFLTFFPAVTLVAVLGGVGPAMFALVICVVLASYSFIPPFQSFPLTFHATIIWINFIFCVEELLVIFVVEAMYRQRGNYLATADLLKQVAAAKQELQISAATFDSQEGIMITNANAVILRVNKAFTEITGYSSEELVGKTPRIFKSDRHDATFYAAMWDSIHRVGVWQGEIWDRRKNGEIYPKWLSITAIKDVNGETTHYVATHADITAQKAAEAEIKNLAFYDPLTKLPNRRLLIDRLEQALAHSQRNLNFGALMFIDMDNFKILNDTHGHRYGDLLLVEVAERLNQIVRETDTVARIGGDEFVVLLQDVDLTAEGTSQKVALIAEKIRTAIATPYCLLGHEHYSSPSIGVCLFFGNEMPVDDLLKQADAAMYHAKHAGRNIVRFFDPELQRSIESRGLLESDLHHALSEHQFHLYYQLQVDNDNNPLGAEALIRWIHPKRGMVSPADFIPVAEESSIIIDMGYWVLEHACLRLAEWSKNDRTKNLILAVNVSAHQFRMANFVETISGLVSEHHIRPSRLKIELTETVVLSDVDDVITKMYALKGLGIRLSLDDFGTGYSSLAYLKKLPIDQLKIDQSFVRDIATDPNDAMMVKTIIDLAKNFRLKVIAEGVETKEQHAFLKQNGCMAYQGYLFSKPIPIEEFEKVLDKIQPNQDSYKSQLGQAAKDLIAVN
ncbi:MAG: putative bifunctional diguanylate cyclase/phosphodiesterase [Methylomonas sp.]